MSANYVNVCTFFALCCKEQTKKSTRHGIEGGIDVRQAKINSDALTHSKRKKKHNALIRKSWLWCLIFVCLLWIIFAPSFLVLVCNVAILAPSIHFFWNCKFYSDLRNPDCTGNTKIKQNKKAWQQRASKRNTTPYWQKEYRHDMWMVESKLKSRMCLCIERANCT